VPHNNRIATAAVYTGIEIRLLRASGIPTVISGRDLHTVLQDCGNFFTAGGTDVGATPNAPPGPTSHARTRPTTLSAAGRKRLSAAMKARWEKTRAERLAAGGGANPVPAGRSRKTTPKVAAAGG
jgi:hypothetical protein